MIHGLWNTSSIFSSITPKLDNIGIEYFAPTLEHSYGMTSILDLTNKLNELILEKYGLEKEIDILGFSMGGIIGRHWLQKFNGYKRTRRLISIGSPHKGTLMAQLIPKYPFRGISEMKINSKFLKELAKNDFFLDDIGIEYFAPTLEHSYGMTSILDLTNILNELILEKYGLEKEIDILGFSMGGIIGRYWLQKFNGYKRTRRLISIGSPLSVIHI